MANLNEMSDSELAKWQSGWRPDTSNYILAEKEWAQRLAIRQLKEQFRLEERLARVNRWWSIGVAVIGVLGVLAGTWFGVYLESSRSSNSESRISINTPLSNSESNMMQPSKKLPPNNSLKRDRQKAAAP